MWFILRVCLFCFPPFQYSFQFFISSDLVLVSIPITFYHFYSLFTDLFLKQIVSVIIIKELIIENEASCKVKILIDSLILTCVQVIEKLVNDLMVLLRCILNVKSMWIHFQKTLKFDVYDCVTLRFLSNWTNDVS